MLAPRSARCTGQPGVPRTPAGVQALITEHRILASMAGRLGRPGSPAATAAQAAAISAVFASQVDKEDSLLVPALEHSGTRPGRRPCGESRLAGGQRAA